ncbi:hypothetical protein [Streptomyces sp. NPDC013457]|uniref:hypothetical protein n=1 Tax=Streptomyces sp. NPDC013457 TaxID=3364866 RepID=UPI0036F546DC
MDPTNTTTPAPAPTSEAPPLPVMRRMTEADATTGPGPTTRSGLGAPLRELPPTATPAAPLLGGRERRPAAPTGRTSVQRDAVNPGGAPAVASGPSQTPSAQPRPPLPLVPVARAVERAAGPAGSNPPSGGAPTRPAAGLITAAATAVQRSRRLLPERPLVVSTGVPEGFSAQPAPAQAAGAASRPVVAATWRREPAPAPASGQRAADRRPRTGHPARQVGSGGAAPELRTATTTAPVQRATTAPVPTPAPAPTPTPAPVRAADAPPVVPRVRLDPTPGHSASAPASVQRTASPLPMPFTRGAGPGLGAEPSPPPVVKAPAANRLQARAVQRMAQEGLGGVPVTPVTRATPATPPSATEPTSPAPPAAAAKSTPASNPRGPEIEELARQLIDPVARLLRAEMRRGRERTGRPYDSRR